MQLALGVADDIGYTPTDRDRDHPDELLGSINDDPQVNVHQRVAAHLDVAGSAPSPLHEAIAKLQAAGRRVAVVTTNFDRHLSTALAALGPDEFLAPALPMGDDFEGLVYLHGSLIQPCERLVVTDTDFGAAYLRDGWAARFLERMFRRYTVLFVGYSHNDVVMSYLARSLGRDGRRYALTEPGTDKRWARLGIMPVTYPNRDRKHAAASATIDAWATWLSMGMLEHRARVAKVVSTPPPLTPPDDSYLASIVADDEKVALFTEHARGAEWLSWASSQRPFVGLFNQDATPTCSGGILADWFAQHFVMDKALTDRAFSVVLTAGGRLGPQLAYSIGRSLGSATAPRPTWLNRWLLLLIAQAPPQAMWLGQALVRSQIPADIDVALLLFDRLSEPHAAYRPAYGESVPPSIDTRPIGEPYWLRQTWADVFGPHLELVAPLVIPVVNRHLRRAHQLVAAHSGKQRPFDMASFSRPAIEGHAQNEPRRPLDPLIDAARDCLQALLDTGTALRPTTSTRGQNRMPLS